MATKSLHIFSIAIFHVLGKEDMARPAEKCPFMSSNGEMVWEKASAAVEQDIIESTASAPSKPFEYEAFFRDQIRKKKDDHSYRVFKKVNRLATHFPSANEYSWGERPITVWCSNDYLGMSCHPAVKNAVM